MPNPRWTKSQRHKLARERATKLFLKFEDAEFLSRREVLPVEQCGDIGVSVHGAVPNKRWAGSVLRKVSSQPAYVAVRIGVSAMARSMSSREAWRPLPANV